VRPLRLVVMHSEAHMSERAARAELLCVRQQRPHKSTLRL
jgi:hypothetical protein